LRYDYTRIQLTGQYYRYIAVESEPRVSFSRWPTNDFHEALKEELYPALLEEDLTGPVCQISRLLEASTLLDKLHVIVKGSTAEHIFKLDEIMLLLDASNNLRTILLGEAEDGHEGYSGALALCNMFVDLLPLSRLLVRVGVSGADLGTVAYFYYTKTELKFLPPMK
jgi:hypothetical protein